MSENVKKEYQEKELKPKNGFAMLFLVILLGIAAIAMFVVGIIRLTQEGDAVTAPSLVLFIGAFLVMFAVMIMCAGFRIVGPNEAIVLTLFGKYVGSVKTEGFYWVNPFCANASSKTKGVAPSGKMGEDTIAALGSTFTAPKKKLSLKAITLTNGKQKVNDLEGNPIEIGVVVIWKIINTAKAVFNVDDYFDFVSTQADASIRQVARLYPYDVSEEGDEKSLRGSSMEIAEMLKQELQGRVDIAGIEILEARISHLAYAPEIAAAMLQRQQASAIIAARQMIVEGAVGMVQMALEKLSKNEIVELDEERKAQMVSNLLVVLCGNKDAQPIVNSGSIY